MDIKRKLELVEMKVKSITDHRDEDAAVRKAALAKIGDMLAAEGARIDVEVQAQIEQAVG